MDYILLLLAWLLCGVLAYGMAYGYFTRKWKYGTDKEDRWWAIKWGMGGPITMVMGYFLSKKVKYGTRYI